MNCTKCGSSQVHVTDTRAKGTRWRHCLTCGNRWTTLELPVGDLRQAVGVINGLEGRKHGKKHPAK